MASITFSLPASMQQDDYVLVAVDTAGGNANRTFNESSGTWTKHADVYGDGSSTDANLAVFGKKMGATPDSSITVSISAGTGQWSGIALAYRGVDPTTPLDTAVVTTSGTGAGGPDPAPGAITTASNGAEVVLFGGSGENSGTVTFPSGFPTFQVDMPGTSPNNRTCSASKNQASAGLVTPGVFDISTATTIRAIAAVTIALRPAPTPPITGTAGHENISQFGTGKTDLLAGRLYGRGPYGVSRYSVAETKQLLGTGLADADSFGGGSFVVWFPIFGTGFANVNQFGSGVLTPEGKLLGTGYENVNEFGTGDIELDWGPGPDESLDTNIDIWVDVAVDTPESWTDVPTDAPDAWS